MLTTIDYSRLSSCGGTDSIIGDSPNYVPLHINRAVGTLPLGMAHLYAASYRLPGLWDKPVEIPYANLILEKVLP